MDRTAFNTTDRPLVVDDEGRVVPGLDWGTVSTTNDRVTSLLDQGLLVLVDEPKGGVDADSPAADAFDRTRAVASLRKQWGALSVDRLRDAAVDLGVVDAETADDSDKQTLVDALANRTDLSVPAETPSAPSTD